LENTIAAVAKNSLKAGISVRVIAEITGLSVDEMTSGRIFLKILKSFQRVFYCNTTSISLKVSICTTSSFW
jgi:hypothetical protein